MTKLQQQLIEFHRAFEHPIQPHPVIARDERVRLRAALIVEECLEFVEACFDDKATLGSRPMYVHEILGEARAKLEIIIKFAACKVDLIKAADALADIDYVVEGSRLEFGIDGGPIADEVHRSNMAKLGGTKSLTGKTLKPKGWTPPNIHGCLIAQEHTEHSLGGIIERNEFLSKLQKQNENTVKHYEVVGSCDHGVTFDEEAARIEKLDEHQVRRRWPRLMGPCPKGCGFNGIAYASTAHFVYGDW